MWWPRTQPQPPGQRPQPQQQQRTSHPATLHKAVSPSPGLLPSSLSVCSSRSDSSSSSSTRACRLKKPTYWRSCSSLTSACTPAAAPPPTSSPGTRHPAQPSCLHWQLLAAHQAEPGGAQSPQLLRHPSGAAPSLRPRLRPRAGKAAPMLLLSSNWQQCGARAVAAVQTAAAVAVMCLQPQRTGSSSSQRLLRRSRPSWSACPGLLLQMQPAHPAISS